MPTGIRRLLIALPLATLLALPFAAGGMSAPVDPAAVQEKIQEAVTRLKLTPAQQEKLKPVFQARMEKLKAIRDRHGGDTSRRARREMLKEAQPVQKEYEAQVEAVLDASQLAEWKKMRAEAREQIKTALRARAGQA